MEIEAHLNTPYVKLDKENCALTIKGKSYPEHPTIFYTPILNELKDCMSSLGNVGITVNLALEIMNSVSTKYIYNIISNISKSSDKIKINWYYEEDDQDMEEEGQQLTTTFKNVNVNLIIMEDIRNL